MGPMELVVTCYSFSWRLYRWVNGYGSHHLSRPRDLDRRGRRSASGVVEPRPGAHDDGARRGAGGEVDVGQAEALQARVGCSA